MWISSQAADTTDLTSLFTTAILSYWAFDKWCDSRWLTIGTCTRSCVAALLLGLEDLVAVIMNDEQANLFFLNGFHRLEERGKMFAVQAAVVARVTEGDLSELMSDPRVGQTYLALWQVWLRTWLG